MSTITIDNGRMARARLFLMLAGEGKPTDEDARAIFDHFAELGVDIKYYNLELLARAWLGDDQDFSGSSHAASGVKRSSGGHGKSALAKERDPLPLSTLNYPPEIAQMQPTEAFDEIWYWVYERWGIYEARRAGKPSPWTDDDYIGSHRFCNVFREMDRESQHVLRISNSGQSLEFFEEMFLKVILFKQYNKFPTWELLTKHLGEEPSISSFSVERYLDILKNKRGKEGVFNSQAYLPGTSLKGALDSLADMMASRAPEAILGMRSLDEVADILQTFDGVGTFKGAQFALDLNGGPWLNLPVDKFCVCGPGARDGIDTAFLSHIGYDETCRIVCSTADACSEEAMGIPVPRLEGRAPYPMTVQNFMCELDKLVWQHAKAGYHVSPGTVRPLPAPILPPWWTL